MALIHCTGKLVYNHPAIDGIATVQGYSRDWPITRAHTWSGVGVEGIEPLQAIAPVGDGRPSSMAAAWAIDGDYSQAVRSVWMPGNPAAVSVEFHDGAVYAAGTAATTYAALLATSPSEAYWQPNLALTMIRYAPPPAQGVLPQTSVGIWGQVRVTLSDGGYYLDSAGSWTNATLVLGIPFASEIYKSPRLSWYLGRDGTTLPAATTTFAEGPATGQALDGGPARETWFLETVYDASLFDGCHFLIRNSGGADWWHVYNENIRVVSGQVWLGMAGCRQIVNVSPIYYSNASGLYGATDTVCTAWANDHNPLPSDEYETDATWGSITSDAPTGSTWTTAVETKDSAVVSAAVGYRPLVTFTPDDAAAWTRPVCWLAYEDHLATIAVPAGLPAAEDTDEDANLYDLDLSFNSQWRGAGGTARFYRRGEAQYEDWLERGRITVTLGWQTDPAPGGDLAAAEIATLWIKPEGIRRGRDGDVELGRPSLEVELGDLIDVRLQDTAIVDMGQAGGFTAESWWETCGNRLGLPDARVYVAPAIAADVLPVATPFPSTPNLKPHDKQSWAAHFDEVTQAAGLRWGYNPFTGKLFLDGGKPEYTEGVSTVSFTLNYDTLTESEVVFGVERTRNGANIRNRYKIVYGDEAHRKVSYWKSAVPDEIQDAGGDLWAVMDETNGQTVADIIKELNEAHRTGLATITFTTFLHRALQPDQFIKCADCPEIGLTVDEVYQITEVRHSRASGTTEVVAAWVYTPGGYW